MLPDSVTRGLMSGGFVCGEDFDGVQKMLMMDALGVKFN